MRPRLVVVSYLAHAPFAPRGIRTRALVRALEDRWRIELVAAPAPADAPAGVRRRRFPKVIGRAADLVVLDKHEPWSVRRLLRWEPAADAGLLVGYPFSPHAYAVPRLVAAGIPYVVDMGDPWALTEPSPDMGGLALLRAKRHERRMWNGAAGAVVTTRRQRDALLRLYPRVPVLVRANGFEPVAASGSFDTSFEPANPSVLRLAHFGTIYEARIGVMPFLRLLAEGGRWERIELHQYGAVVAADVRSEPRVEVVLHDPLPWPDAVAATSGYDAALVIGNVDPQVLPSKAVDYLVLPIARIALTPDPADDSLGRYVADKPGWLALAPDDPLAVDRVVRHVSQVWSPSELSPPRSESWPAVAEEIARFLDAVLVPPTRARPVAA
jgi:hypothetical protein